MILISVLLPQPFSPARQSTSPVITSNLTSSSALTPPNCLETCSTCSKGTPDAGASLAVVGCGSDIVLRSANVRKGESARRRAGQAAKDPKSETHLREVV